MIHSERFLHLFRRHVLRRAHCLIAAGQGEVDLRFAQQLCQAEIGQFHTAFLVDEDICRLNVAVDDPFVVGVLERIANLWDDNQRFGGREFGGLFHLAQVHAVHIFHDEIEQAIGFAKLVDGDDVGVVQLGQCAGFAQEPLGKFRVAAQLRRQDLQGNDPVELFLPSLVHRAHAAHGEQFENLELRKVFGDLGQVRCGSRRQGRRQGRRLGCGLGFSTAAEADFEHAGRAEVVADGCVEGFTALLTSFHNLQFVLSTLTTTKWGKGYGKSET